MTQINPAELYHIGLTLNLKVLHSASVSSSLQVNVTSCFLPFTKSQVMRITIPSAHDGSDLPIKAVLKLYDRRCIDDREERLWSPSREVIARAAWRDKKWIGKTEPYDLAVMGEDEWEEYFRELAQVIAVIVVQVIALFNLLWYLVITGSL